MCDRDHSAEDRERYEALGLITRKQFGVMLAAGVAMLLPKVANAATVIESDVTVKTPDGTADCYFVHPATGTAPGILVWPDIFGLRPAMRQMGKRLAEAGYSVLVVNPSTGPESSDRGSGRGDSDSAVAAARENPGRDHAGDGCEGICRMAGPAILGCQKSQDGNAGLLHGRGDGLSYRLCSAGPRRRRGLLPRRQRVGDHYAGQSTSSGRDDQGAVPGRNCGK